MLTAIVRYTRKGNITSIQSDYTTKKQLKDDLKGNKIIILGIYTSEQIAEVKTKKHYEINTAEEYIQQCL